MPCWAIWLTMALPTTTASALAATVFACSGVEMPKPTAMGRLVWARIFAVICVIVSATFDLHAGDAFARDVVNEARAALDDQFDAVIGCGRRDEVDIAKPGLAHERLVAVALLGGQIQNQQTIHTGLGRVPDEPLSLSATPLARVSSRAPRGDSPFVPVARVVGVQQDDLLPSLPVGVQPELEPELAQPSDQLPSQECGLPHRAR